MVLGTMTSSEFSVVQGCMEVEEVRQDMEHLRATELADEDAATMPDEHEDAATMRDMKQEDI